MRRLPGPQIPGQPLSARAAWRLYKEHGAVLLRPGHHATTGVQKVRNQATGRVLPCCYGDCERDGDNRHRVEVPHKEPRWRDPATDPATGRQEMLVYIFCGERCKRAWLVGTPYADKV